jgi:hypothetical protein
MYHIHLLFTIPNRRRDGAFITQINDALKAKSARLDELNIMLNMDKTENEIVDDERDDDEPDGHSTKEYER